MLSLSVALIVCRRAQHLYSDVQAETCSQCILRRPGVETWGCTLTEIHKWCQMGFEGSDPNAIGSAFAAHPNAIRSEEEHRNYVAPDEFVKHDHTAYKVYQKQLSQGIQMFATLLEKFDQAHPKVSVVR